MKRDYFEGLASVMMILALSFLINLVLIKFPIFENNISNLKEAETTTAKPIYQQQIGDEAEPDILIIYEAEVDGVKVYPSVIKEAK